MATDAQSTSYKSIFVFESNAAKFSITEFATLLQDISTLHQEHLICFSLNSNHEIIARHTVFIGTLTGSFAHPREIFGYALADHAAAIVIAHNHPSGNPEPSDKDIGTTEELIAVGQIMGIPLLDHIIIGKHGHYSFLANGMMLWGKLFKSGFEVRSQRLLLP